MNISWGPQHIRAVKLPMSRASNTAGNLSSIPDPNCGMRPQGHVPTWPCEGLMQCCAEAGQGPTGPQGPLPQPGPLPRGPHDNPLCILSCPVGPSSSSWGPVSEQPQPTLGERHGPLHIVLCVSVSTDQHPFKGPAPPCSTAPFLQYPLCTFSPPAPKSRGAAARGQEPCDHSPPRVDPASHSGCGSDRVEHLWSVRQGTVHTLRREGRARVPVGRQQPSSTPSLQARGAAPP